MCLFNQNNFLKIMPFISPLLTTGISAGSSLLGGVLGGIFGGYQQKKANEYNRKMLAQQFQYNKQLAEEEFRRNVEMWQMQTAYNSPANQLARLTQAGINPHLAYAKGSINNVASQAPSYNAPSYGYEGSALPDTSGYISAGQNAAENVVRSTLSNDNLSAQGDYIRAQTQKVLLEAAAQETDNEIKRALKAEAISQGRFKTKILETEVDEKKWIVDNLVQTYEGKKLLNEFNAHTIDDRIDQVRFAVKLIKANIALKAAQTRSENYRRENFMPAQVDNIKAHTNLTNEQWNIIKKQAGFTGPVSDLKLLYEYIQEGTMDGLESGIIGTHIGIRDVGSLVGLLGGGKTKVIQKLAGSVKPSRKVK